MTVRAYDRSDRGSGSMIMLGVMMIIGALSVVGVCIAGYLVAGHRARAAADLAALSGAGAISRGLDGCRAARDNARANDAEITRCDQVGDEIDFVITAMVALEVTTPWPGLPSRVVAVAYAGSSQ
jgi:secretion/DNA translocation related TadE-like protein